jgi:hypothetical protein
MEKLGKGRIANTMYLMESTEALNIVSSLLGRCTSGWSFVEEVKEVTSE